MKTLHSFFNTQKRLYLLYPGITICVWLASWFLIAILSTLVTLNDGAATFAIVVGLANLQLIPMGYYLRQLERRIVENWNGPVWTVWVNDVEVGRINDSKMAHIQSEVAFDSRTYILQISNIASVFLRLGKYLLVVMPILAFWIIIASATISPDTFTTGFAHFKTDTSAQVASTVTNFVWLLGTFSLIVIVLFEFMTIERRFFGLKSSFHNKCEQLVRIHVGCASDGEISIAINEHAMDFPKDHDGVFIADNFDLEVSSK